MKKIIKGKILIWPVIGLFLLTTSCNNKSETHELASNLESNSSAKKSTAKEPSQAFKDYWYAGKAEITSYKLEQARYGEIREGKAVLIYVTEDFLPNKQVKADNQNPNNISVLKLNATKKFNTGLYPYSIMQSTFYPVSNNQHAIKITSSIQEWCGQVYAQLNNKDKFEVASYSYFESEGDKNFKLEKSILENELWTQLRIDPKSLPVGSLQIIPSLEYSRLKHVDLKAYNAQVSLTSNTYSIKYPELDRTLTIQFNPNFPHDILGWEETFKSGFGKNAKTLTTKAIKLKTIKSAYWGKNSNKDEVLRDTLQLN
ncbi:septum formation inhibitor Maf [Hwangdonia seohaensis]|uniref:Septum formation inhibitor Maf n=1 Tax=Hwangdonia seohaensis TaxID=1240727 RepID=A0ABW3RCS0_9FLAO|nr:septum formation inhibitor Maf [Hwangdonia seohaensis]